MRKMADAVLYTKLSASDLVEKIMFAVHKSNIQDIKKELTTYPTPFEKAVETEQVSEFLDSCQAKFIVDNYIDWTQVIILLPRNKFVMWHGYTEWHTDEEYLVYGATDNGTINIDKFYYVNHKCADEVDNTMEEHMDHCRNHIPFQFMANHMDSDNYLDFNQPYHSIKVWQNPEKVLAWFNSQEWQV